MTVEGVDRHADQQGGNEVSGRETERQAGRMAGRETGRQAAGEGRVKQPGSHWSLEVG